MGDLDKLAAALNRAQSQVTGAIKDSSNPFFKSKYADLASVSGACKSAFTDNGLSVVQMPGFANGVATVRCVILHCSGQTLDCGEAGAPLAKADAQGVGSVLTYLRRYQLAAIAWVTPEDDDGNAASETVKPTSKARPLVRSSAATRSSDVSKPEPLRLNGKLLKDCTSLTLIEAGKFYKDRPDAVALLDAIALELDRRRETAVDSLSV